MKKFLSVLLLALLAFSLVGCGDAKNTAATSEEPSDVIKIGVMQFGEFTALQNCYEGFVEGLKENGYVDGENVEIIYLSAAADTANCPTIADTLINNGVDLIFAIATPSASAIKEKTATIPVLFSAVTDPCASGLVASNSAPGANLSGTSDMNPVAEQIDLVKKIVPDANTVAVVYCSSESNSAIQFQMAKSQIESLGMTCVEKTISAVDEAKSAIESLQGVVDAIYIPTDNTLADAMTLVSATANECGLPIIAGEPGQVQNGALITYGINYTALGKQTANMAIKVLEADDAVATISAMPVECQTEGLVIAVNQASADTLGITIPAELLDGAEIY